MRGGSRSLSESDGGHSVIARSEATKQSIYLRVQRGGLLRFARNDGEDYFAATTVVVASAGRLASSACSVLMVE